MRTFTLVGFVLMCAKYREKLFIILGGRGKKRSMRDNSNDGYDGKGLEEDFRIAN